ncbi:MAG TPA: N-acetyl-gamma-glutamyl-phosphate reductase [Bacillota bacterium]|nr:N-acetyl-gamma-glutamyl-phosphate reductase [Bacillota bacterium]
MNVAIIGATGYGGIELLRLLHQHPFVKVYAIYSSSQEGTNIAALYPHIHTIISHDLQTLDIDHIAKEVDIIFTSTPSGVAGKIVPQLLEKGVKVIDLSGDFRIDDPDIYKEYYNMNQRATQLQKKAIYGLPEWSSFDSSLSFIANPGCFPTVALLGLAPIVQELTIDPASIIIDAKTGVSGAGRSASEATHYPTVNDSVVAYKVNEHQHTPEIEQQLKKWNHTISAITFTPHLIPMTRGIMATMYVTLEEKVTSDEVHHLFTETYRNHPFVRIRPLHSFPRTKEVQGSNFCDIGISYDERTSRLTIVSVIDNLVKGASGQAIQNMNLLCGFDEGAGLQHVPLYP